MLYLVSWLQNVTAVEGLWSLGYISASGSTKQKMKTSKNFGRILTYFNFVHTRIKYDVLCSPLKYIQMQMQSCIFVFLALQSFLFNKFWCLDGLPFPAANQFSFLICRSRELNTTFVFNFFNYHETYNVPWLNITIL